MGQTRKYGTLDNASQELGYPRVTVRESIVAALGDHGNGYDLDGLEEEYRAHVKDALHGTGITLMGNDFIGPQEPTEGQSAAMRALSACTESDMNLSPMAAAISLSDLLFWGMAAKHEK